MMHRGLLSPSEERWLARFLARLIKFDSRVLELVEYPVWLGLIRIADNQLIDRFVPDSWQNPFRRLIDLSKHLDTDGIGQLVSSNYAATFPMPVKLAPLQERLMRNAYGLLEAKIYDGLLTVRMRGMTRRQIRKLNKQKK